MNAKEVLDMVDTEPKLPDNFAERDLITVNDKSEQKLVKAILKLYRKPAGTLTPDEYQKLGALLALRP